MARTSLVSWMILGFAAGAFGCSSGDVPVAERNAPLNQGGAAGSTVASSSGGAGGSVSNGGAGGAVSSGAGGSEAPGSDAGTPNPDGANGDPRARAATYARDDIPCNVDSDCCLVTDRCLNSALVVGAADKDTVTSLIRSADMTRCTGCIAAFVQVSCNQGKCLGTSVDYRSPDSAAPDPRLAQDHCGSLDGPQTPKRTGSMFGCGG